ncbi:helix-turn-helix domain-containing protein [Lactococcus garvieae]|uniref:Helix-turn-helix transcriptional regulator n=1 Tax=Lactococcus garvieae TaxID=1363 RepID=A0AAX3NB93_9LACT|nr:helix-turn-helix transcriptional regulator [Lactococcus garvieae]WEA13300.1 helix-turn-helix transcriptional regulator [Lactococcus garvieae]
MLKTRLKLARLKKGLTQKQVAEKLEISQAMYQKWEQGLRNPKQDTIKRLAIALEVSPEYLSGELYIINLEEYDPSEEDIKKINQLVANYFKNKNS